MVKQQTICKMFLWKLMRFHILVFNSTTEAFLWYVVCDEHNSYYAPYKLLSAFIYKINWYWVEIQQILYLRLLNINIFDGSILTLNSQ